MALSGKLLRTLLKNSRDNACQFLRFLAEDDILCDGGPRLSDGGRSDVADSDNLTMAIFASTTTLHSYLCLVLSERIASQVSIQWSKTPYSILLHTSDAIDRTLIQIMSDQQHPLGYWSQMASCFGRYHMRHVHGNLSKRELDNISFVIRAIQAHASYYDVVYNQEGYSAEDLRWIKYPEQELSSQIGKVSDYEMWSNTVDAILRLRGVSGCLSKVVIDRPDLDQKCRLDAIAFEDDMPTSMPAPHLVRRAKELWDKHSLVLNPHTFSPAPKHGPGVVADKTIRSRYAKYAKMEYSSLIDYLLKGSIIDYNPLILSAKTDRTSRFLCVPKNAKKLRGISAEPAVNMYFQQSIKDEFYKFFQTDIWWRKRVKLDDNNYSKSFARLGSIDGSYATIDLSSASDSVRLDMVNTIFGNTLLSRWLRATRSTCTRFTDDDVRQLKKFAPMGSAVCFPVECILFTLIAEIAIDDEWKTTPRHVRPKKGFAVVYGDDIIVPSYAALRTVRYLSLCGFQVNEDKTFLTGYFKESCGGDYWCGNSVRPFFFRKIREKELCPRNAPIGPASLQSLIDTLNNMRIRNLEETRGCFVRYLINEIFGSRTWDRCQAYMLYADGTHGSLLTYGSLQSTNLPSIASCDIQQPGYIIHQMVCKTKPMKGPRVEEILYLEWLLAHQRKEDSFRTDIPTGDTKVLPSERSTTRVRKTWICNPYFVPSGRKRNTHTIRRNVRSG